MCRLGGSPRVTEEPKQMKIICHLDLSVDHTMARAEQLALASGALSCVTLGRQTGATCASSSSSVRVRGRGRGGKDDTHSRAISARQRD